MVGQERNHDAHAEVHAIVERHQLHYSLVQLRLVGILLLLVLATRAFGLFFGLEGPSIQQLSAISSLSNSLPLLPLGISLYLLGGGRQRQPREFAPTELLHRCLVPLALVCLLVLPIITVHNMMRISGDLRSAENAEQALLRSQAEWLARADRASTPQEVAALANQYGIQMPVANLEPVHLSRWRLARTLELEQDKFRKTFPLLNLSPYQRELLSFFRISSTLLMQLITGFGLLLLYRQGSREIQRHGLNIALFFRVDPDKKRRRLSY